MTRLILTIVFIGIPLGCLIVVTVIEEIEIRHDIKRNGWWPDSST